MTITKSVSIIAPPGIYAVHAAPAQMIVLDSIVRDNGGGGISIGGGASVVLDYVRVERNAGDGVTLAGTALGVSAEIRNSLFAHNGFSGVAAVIPGGSAKTGVVMEDSSISQNAADGVFAGGIGDGTLLSR